MLTQDTHSMEAEILTPPAREFLTKLHHKFNPTRLDLLRKRVERQKQLDQGILPTFLPETIKIRQDPKWRVATIPSDLQKRWVEITGPTDRKMMINALNSGANVFMADFEDATSPTWKNILEGQHNLKEAVAGTLALTQPGGKEYRLNPSTAVLSVRPRGWHLNETHMLIDNEPMSASLFDFGLTFYNNAHALIKKGSGPYFYLPKMESHLEARLWNDVFIFAQQELKIPVGTIRATVLIETILAAFEMEEILYELREHSSGLNAGRWDYIFSIIKKFHYDPSFIFPDRSQIVMTVPFMRAYTSLLVQTCHRRGASAIGGMAAFVPSRKDAAVNELAMKKVREDKERESQDGFDGTWVAHPDLVEIAHEVFAKALHDQPNQIHKELNAEQITPKMLLNFKIPDGKVSDAGVHQNIDVALSYLTAWLSGMGAVAIHNLMEDTATAEISRAQLWQWIHHHTILSSGQTMNKEYYLSIVKQETGKLEASYRDQPELLQKLHMARKLLDHLVLDHQFADFLTHQKL